MSNLYKITLFVLLLVLPALATHVAVLETTLADASAKDGVSLSDRQYLTNVLREQAVKVLPATHNYVIMTRENINAMLPPGKAVEDCEGSCVVETGRNISADYVCQPYVSRFGSMLTFSAELYETLSNKLIASFNGRGATVEELLEIIEEKAPNFFCSISMLTGEKKTCPLKMHEDVYERAYTEIDGNNINYEGRDVSTNINDEPMGNNSLRWILLGVGAAASVTGVVLAVIGNNKAKDAADKGGKTEAELDRNMSDAESGQNLRTTGITIAIVGTVGIGISFAF